MVTFATASAAAPAPPREWETARLIATPASCEHAPALFESYTSDPEVARYMLWRVHRDLGETEAYLRTCESAWAGGTSFPWSLRLKAEGVAVGVLTARVRGDSLDFGYALGRRWWRRGLMSEAATWLVQWAMQQAPIARVWATCDVDNVASARLLERLGMQREGMLRRWVGRPNLGDAPRDSFAYSILKS